MENSGGIQASLAGRYAIALFGLARDENKIDAVGKSLGLLDAALAESGDLSTLVSSPMVSRADAAKAVRALGTTLKLDPISANFIGVLASNGRLSQLQNVIGLYRRLAADARGETTAEVATAHPLSADQLKSLQSKLKARVGRDVAIDATVNPDLLGGMTIKLGSQMIDASIRTKLNTLATAMKG
nr:F0F1 ATP synthase subunit delta [uncultured Sphingomonas sp.]